MCKRTASLLLVLATANGTADVVTYEARTTFPEATGWTRDFFCDPDRWLDDGWLFQHVDPPPPKCGDPPHGDNDYYNRSLADFFGTPAFVIEWRMETDGDASEIVGAAPAVLVAGGFAGVNYHFTIARDQVRLIRDNILPILYIDVESGVPHTYRLELFADELYVWYIDGTVVDSGTPEGAFPTQFAQITFSAGSFFLDSTVWWDYIRYGAIPDDASFDFDGDDDVDADDFYYVRDCLTKDGPAIFGGPENDAGPGCRFADFDADTDVDLRDIAAFQNAFTGEGQ